MFIPIHPKRRSRYQLDLSPLAKEAKDWQRALLLLAMLGEKNSARDVMSYNGAVSACGLRSRWQEALGCFQALEAGGREGQGGSFLRR